MVTQESLILIILNDDHLPNVESLCHELGNLNFRNFSAFKGIGVRRMELLTWENFEDKISFKEGRICNTLRIQSVCLVLIHDYM